MIGVLLINLGTPTAATPKAVRSYLREFLTDPWVITLPTPLRWLLLNTLILPIRPYKTAKLYQKIWQPEGSPLLVYSQRLARKLQQQLPDMSIALAMRYGEPSISQALTTLQGMERIIVLPLYPQYSLATTATALNAITLAIQTWPKKPIIDPIYDYAEHPAYLEAIAQTLLCYQPLPYLLFSFHGLPRYYLAKKDPYPSRCQRTATLLAERLQISPQQWSYAFQSRLGCRRWLAPYTQTVLERLPQQNIVDIAVICPGFAVDCLETLEEIAIRGQAQFQKAGGLTFRYIPALNDTDTHVQALCHMIEEKRQNQW